MQKMTLKSYAVKHKMSFFSVVKLVKSGKIKSRTEEVDGKEVTYILPEEKESDPGQKVEKKELKNEPFDLEKELKKLILEVETLKEEIEKLKK